MVKRKGNMMNKFKLVLIGLVIVTLVNIGIILYKSGMERGQLETYPKAFICIVLGEGQKWDCRQIEQNIY